MPLTLPETRSLKLERAGGFLFATLNRPESRNALDAEMVAEFSALADALAHESGIRALILRGAGGTFCAGGDIKGFRALLSASAPEPGAADPIAAHNREFGALLERLDALPLVVIAVVEGMALGGGFGLACIADLVLAGSDARFALSETGLGIPPAQIAPFILRRVGLSQARRLALTGARLDAAAALAIGLVHQIAETGPALDALLAATLDQIGRCAPGANAATKAILRAAAETPLAAALDTAADGFARCLRGPEGQDGVAAFLGKRPPGWLERGPAA